MFPLSEMLKRLIQKGTLTVTDVEGKTHLFGGKAPGPAVTMKLSDKALYKKLFFSPEMSAGEAYMDGIDIFKKDDFDCKNNTVKLTYSNTEI